MEKKIYAPSHSIRITFAGIMLPDYLEIERVLIPVRLFTPKPMMCTRCQRYGHSERYCSNKPRCSRCGQLHQPEMCTSNLNTCLHCKGTHTLITDCSEYKKQAVAAKMNLLQRSRKTYAEVVQSSQPKIVSPNSFSALSDSSDMDEDMPHCSLQMTPKKQKLRKRTNPISSPPIHTSTKRNRETNTPPADHQLVLSTVPPLDMQICNDQRRAPVNDKQPKSLTMPTPVPMPKSSTMPNHPVSHKSSAMPKPKTKSTPESVPTTIPSLSNERSVADLIVLVSLVFNLDT